MGSSRILMCRPDHFAVGYSINPWMKGNIGQLDKSLAISQWETLYRALNEVAEVVLIEPVAGLPDMVFTANAGTVYGGKAVVSRFYHEERQGEEEHFARWFDAHGFEVLVLPDDYAYEGAGDSLLDRGGGWLWAGHGFRSDLEVHDLLRDWFDIEVLPIRLVDPRFYHIDTCFCPLTGGYLMYHPAAFDDASNQLIERRVPREKRLPITVRDAGRFGCNAVCVDDQVFLNQISDGLRQRLHAAGFNVVETPLGEFLKSGGSAKCLTLKLDEPETAQ